MQTNSLQIMAREGSLGPGPGDRTGGILYRVEAWGQTAALNFHGNGVHAIVYSYHLPQLLNFYRDLGAAIDFLQPGLINPLPDDSPDFVDALKVIHEADRIRTERKSL